MRGRDEPWRPYESLTRETADQVGRMLWAAHLASVAFRYPDDEDGERPAPEGFADADVSAYTFQEIPGSVDPVVVLKSIGCYQYQSSEHETWSDSQAFRFCRVLKATAIDRLPGYDEAPWGFDDRDYFVTAG